jgi:hypothetical protein
MIKQSEFQGKVQPNAISEEDKATAAEQKTVEKA